MCQFIEKYRFKTVEEDSNKYFKHSLEKLMNRNLKENQQVIILCIGSDYIVGDCLGPLIGYKLKLIYQGLTVFGNFGNTVHSANLIETLNFIDDEYKKPFIIAIDSLLCVNSTQIGDVTLWDGGFFPGKAFGKPLPRVGHIGITGTINLNIPFEKFIQTTKMGFVMHLADFIVAGLSYTLSKLDLIK